MKAREYQRLIKIPYLFGWGIFDSLIPTLFSFKITLPFLLLYFLPYPLLYVIIKEILIISINFNRCDRVYFPGASVVTSFLLMYALQCNIERLSDSLDFGYDYLPESINETLTLLLDSVFTAYQIFHYSFIFSSKPISFPKRIEYFTTHFEYYCGYCLWLNLIDERLRVAGIVYLLHTRSVMNQSETEVKYLRYLPNAKCDEYSVFDIIEGVGERLLTFSFQKIYQKIKTYMK